MDSVHVDISTVPSSSSFDCSLVNLPNISLHNSNTSSPDTTYISCDAPLVAPTPMPYHVPEFIDFDFVPLDYESHRLKRKRVDDYECHQRISQKRSVLLAPWPGVEPILSKNHSSTRIKTSRTRARRSGRNRPSQSSRFQIPPKSMYT